MLRNIFVPLQIQCPHEYDLFQIGLHHCSAVTDAPWKIISTKTILDDSGEKVLDPGDLLGELTIPEILASFHPQVIFLFNDPQCILRQLECIPRSFKTVAYVTFDGVPVPREYAALSRVTKLVTMSEFGREAYLMATGVSPHLISVMYAPADTARFRPVSVEEKVEMRSELLPSCIPLDSFIVGWVGRNQWRKQMWTIYHVLSIVRGGNYIECVNCRTVRDPSLGSHFCAKCGDARSEQGKRRLGVYLWIHMPTGRENGTWVLKDLEEYYDMHSERDIYYTDNCDTRHHLHADSIPALYQLWDCLLFLSGGEGFGVPAWEAMASGIPVIYSDYSSHAEYLSNADAGMAIGGILQPEPSNCIMRHVSDIYMAVDAVCKLQDDSSLRRTFGINGRAYCEQYNCLNVAGKWHSLLQIVNST